MKKSTILSTSVILGSIVLASCSSSNMATNGVSDNMYFMASDARMSTQYAVQNNNPESFQELNSRDTENYPQENFSNRNVNPDYISRYQSENEEGEILYFDEATEEQQGNPDINVYNNYYVGGSARNSGFNSSLAFNMGFMHGFSPWGFGFYDPFWGSGLGFRPGFNLSLGFGWGTPFFRPGFGYGSFYDPFWGPSYGWGGYSGFGWGYPAYLSRTIYILPGNEYGDRRIVRGSRPTRGSSLAGSGYSGARSATLPNTARAQARREAMGSDTRSLVSSDRNRTSTRDFGTSQNDYYNSGRSRITSSRNVNSPAIDRSSATRTRSAIPSSRPSYGTSNSGSSLRSRSMNPYNNSRGSVNNPSNNRSTSPSYNRGTTPGRTNSPSYNRSRVNNNNTSSFSAPSRSMGGGISSGGISSGGSRGGGTVSSGSRGGRGN